MPVFGTASKYGRINRAEGEVTERANSNFTRRSTIGCNPVSKLSVGLTLTPGLDTAMPISRHTVPDLREVIGEELLTTAEHALRLVETDPPDTSSDDLPGLRPLILELVTELRAQRRRTARLAVKTGGKVVFLRPDEIDWVEAAGNYVKLHVGADSHLYRESMKNMETRLDGEQFVRIHRSAIVNVDRIRELQPWFHGEYVVILQDGVRLMASRVFSERLDRLIA